MAGLSRGGENGLTVFERAAVLRNASAAQRIAETRRAKAKKRPGPEE